MATKMMQTSAMKACFQIAECSKSSAKVIRIFDLRVFLVNLNAVPLLYLSFLCHFLLSAENNSRKYWRVSFIFIFLQSETNNY